MPITTNVPVERREIDIATVPMEDLRAYKAELDQRFKEIAHQPSYAQHIDILDRQTMVSMAIGARERSLEVNPGDRAVMLNTEQKAAIAIHAEAREELHTHIVNRRLSHYEYSDDEPSRREYKEANKYADRVIAQLEKDNPGAGYSELLNKVEAQDRAQLHPSWDKAVSGPAEEKAKAALLESLAEKHTPPVSHRLGPEDTTKDLREHVERKAEQELDRMIKENPSASYTQLLAQHTADSHAEAIAKRQLVEALQEKHMPAYQPGENTRVVFERATQGAHQELETMEKKNPNASYAEMLAQVKPEEKQQITQSKSQAQAMAV